VVVQVIEHRRQLNADIESSLDREAPDELVQVVFQCLARDKVHHHVSTSLLTEVVVNARQVGVHKIGEDEGFVLKGSGGLSQFLRTEAILTHLLNRYRSIAEKRIFRLVDGPESTSTNLADDTIAGMEQVGRRKRSIDPVYRADSM